MGEKTKTIVCLPGDVPHISHSHAYFQDNVTEKVTENSFLMTQLTTYFDSQLWVFEFNKLEDLQIFIKRYIFYFTDDPGNIEIIISKTF